MLMVLGSGAAPRPASGTKTIGQEGRAGDIRQQGGGPVRRPEELRDPTGSPALGQMKPAIPGPGPLAQRDMGTGDEGILLPGPGRDGVLEGAGNRWSNQDSVLGLLGAGNGQEQGGGPTGADMKLVGLQAGSPHHGVGGGGVSGTSLTHTAPGSHGCPG